MDLNPEYPFASKTPSWWSLVALLLAAGLGCTPTVEGPEILGPGFSEFRLPEGFGELDRPVVMFDHARHIEALPDEDCETCHERDEEGSFDPRFERLAPDEEPDALVDRIHNRCTGCHTERNEGTLVCATCHLDRGPTTTTRVSPVFDHSLHHRHIDATNEECETCHHVWNEDKQELVYVEGEHGTCGDCHGDVVEEDRPTLRDASHQRCVGCHLDRDEAGKEAGPLECSGCHDAEALAAIEPLDAIPRLEVEQPDWALIHTEGAKTKEVSFDHLAHETRTPFCTTCHHQTSKACSVCHTVLGGEEGEGVNLETAHHDAGSDRSCVGCHRREALEPDCAGCHRTLPRPPSESTCAVCHTGPLDEPATRPVLAALPTTSDDDFPEVIVIDVLAADYEPSEMPHAKIVEHLDSLVRESDLAGAFHQTTEALCSGCHHHSPVGDRPPGCGSCHDLESHPTEDQPSLKAAYHRQCMGCHEEMGLEQVGCTDCHADASEEDSP